MNSLSSLAGLPPPRELAPLIALMASMLIPIIVILTRHQQKMTVLLHQKGENQGPAIQDLYSVQQEVQELKSIVSNLALSIESLKDEVRHSSYLQERVRIGE
jgi:hypothetical protein